MISFIGRKIGDWIDYKEKLPAKDVFGVRSNISPTLEKFIRRHMKSIYPYDKLTEDLIHLSVCNIYVCYDPIKRHQLFTNIFITSLGDLGIMHTNNNKNGEYQISDSRLYNKLIELKIDLLGKFGVGYELLEKNYLEACDMYNERFGKPKWFSVSKESDQFVIGIMLILRHYILSDFSEKPTPPPVKK